MIQRQSRKYNCHIRHKRVRKKLRGTSQVPRLSVFKSSRHIYAQVIDDLQSRTLVAASSLTPKAKEMIKDDKKDKLQVSAIVGELLGQLALSKGIKKVCFDRGGFPYHGRIKSFAEAARGAGLEF